MKKIKIITIILFVLVLIFVGINFFVINKNKNNIYGINDLDKEDKVYDYILVLGCSVYNDGVPSLMLKDRLDTTIKLYKAHLAKKIIISGDHSDSYSEVDVMYKYLKDNDIYEEDIIRDDKGYSTGESIKNYYHNYKDKSVIIVTQNYHLYRALYIASKYNLDYIGVYAKKNIYGGQIYREIREELARVKDFIKY